MTQRIPWARSAARARTVEGRHGVRLKTQERAVDIEKRRFDIVILPRRARAAPRPPGTRHRAAWRQKSPDSVAWPRAPRRPAPPPARARISQTQTEGHPWRSCSAATRSRSISTKQVFHDVTLGVTRATASASSARTATASPPCWRFSPEPSSRTRGASRTAATSPWPPRPARCPSTTRRRSTRPSWATCPLTNGRPRRASAASSTG